MRDLTIWIHWLTLAIVSVHLSETSEICTRFSSSEKQQSYSQWTLCWSSTVSPQSPSTLTVSSVVAIMLSMSSDSESQLRCQVHSLTDGSCESHRTFFFFCETINYTAEKTIRNANIASGRSEKPQANQNVTFWADYLNARMWTILIGRQSHQSKGERLLRYTDSTLVFLRFVHD